MSLGTVDQGLATLGAVANAIRIYGAGRTWGDDLRKQRVMQAECVLGHDAMAPGRKEAD